MTRLYPLSLSSSLLLLLLSLSLSLLPFISPSSPSTSVGCLNDCSGHGWCSPALTCICDSGYLSIDCHIPSLMSPLCVPSTSSPSPLCMYWAIRDGIYYHRIVAVTNPSPANSSVSTNPGWAGVLWDNDANTGPMTGGKAVVVTVPSPYSPLVQDYYATTEDTPSLTTVQTIQPSNVTGYSTATTLDVSFQRPCSTSQPQHYSFPTLPGTSTSVGVAWLNSAFGFHNDNAHTFDPIDLVALSTASACPSNCSGNGQCVTVGGSPTCQCSVGYLGSDCSVVSLMAPLCFQQGGLCTYWRIVQGSLFIRIRALTNPKATTTVPAAGYGAVMWGANSDGMTGGLGHRISWNSTAGQPLVWDLYATRRGPPSRSAQQVAFDVAGWATNTSLDVSFQRPLICSDLQHFNLSAAPGVTVPFSVAVGDVTMSHHTWASFGSIDMAGTAAGGPQCLNECSGHGTCSANVTCQCDAGYLGDDCSVPSLMSPLCYNGGSYCLYFRIVDSNLLMRIVAVTNPRSTTSAPAAGYAAIMWGAGTDGMTNGTGHFITWNATTAQPVVRDIFTNRTGHVAPVLATQQVAVNITGIVNATTLDVSFTRSLAAMDRQHYSISTTPGVVVPLSIATGETTFVRHTWRLYTTVDMARSAAGSQCPNDCSGPTNGKCTAAVSCQCMPGYLGADCSVVSIMEPLCYTAPTSASLCLYWRFLPLSQTLLMRIVADVNPAGWAGIMWGASSDGMTGGLGHIVSISSDGYPLVLDVTASNRTLPTRTLTQVSSGLAGFNTSTSIDVSFSRPIAGLDFQHFNLSSDLGTVIPLSVAMGDVFFQHHSYANYSRIDMVAASAGSGCPHACSGHGKCIASTSSCQCDDGYLGLDCGVQRSTHLCPTDDTFCMDWAIIDAVLFMRVRAYVQGWAAVMWGASSDGMSGGKLIQLTMPQGQPTAAEMEASNRVTPFQSKWNGVGLNITGYSTSTYMDWSFVRLCDIGIPQALTIPTAPDVQVALSWAMKDGDWSQHGNSKNVVGQLLVNMHTGEATIISQASLIPVYVPLIVGAVVILLCALLLRLPTVSMSALGRCCLRKRISSLSSDAYALSSAHVQERSPLTSDDSQNSALVIQSDDSATFTTKMGGVLALADNLSLNAVSSVYHLTIGELLVLVVYFTSIAAFVLMAMSASLSWAVTLGHLTAIHLTLSVLPVSRNSVWHFVFGISFERAIKWHRFVSRATASLVALHGVFILSSYGIDVLFSSDPTTYGMGAVYGTLAAGCIFSMAVTAVSLIRRGLFELFYYIHVPLFASTMIFASLHSVYARYYLLPPIALIVLDWIIRFIHHARKVQVIDAAVVHNEDEGSWRAAKLTLKAHMQPQPGQYVFINIPTLSLLQWHPFSISSAPEQNGDEATFTLHLLDMGKGTFTSSVCDVLAASEYSGNGAQVSVSVDGPYGSITIPHDRYPTLLLIAGGIGITPLASILYSLLSTSRDCRVYLIWTSRHAASFHLLFPDLLSRINNDPRMSVELFDTARQGNSRSVKVGRGTEELLRGDSLTEEKDVDGMSKGWTGADSVDGRVDIRRGRPCLPRIFEMVAVDHHQREQKLGAKRVDPVMKGAAGVGVLCCGPTALLDEVEKESMAFGFHLHRETFLL